MFIIDVCVFIFQLYTVSQDGALCVWQCDTDLDGLKPRPPKDRAEEKNESMKDVGEEFIEEPKAEEIHGKATPNEQERREKVKYSRAAKQVIFQRSRYIKIKQA